MWGVDDRHAEWRTTVAFVADQNNFHTFTFAEQGVLAHDVRPKLRDGMSDYHRIYIPTMLDPKNTLALSEMIGDNLDKWREFTSKNNHYQMFGKWFAANATTI